MDREVIFNQLREEFDAKRVSKQTATKAMNIYNAEVSKEERITGCLCTVAKRKIVSKMMLEWYEAIH